MDLSTTGGASRTPSCVLPGLPLTIVMADEASVSNPRSQDVPQTAEMLDTLNIHSNPDQSENDDTLESNMDLENYDSDSSDTDQSEDGIDHSSYFESEGITKEQEKDLTNKFLNGELSFSEYAALMEGDDVDENIVDQPAATSAHDEFQEEMCVVIRQKRRMGTGRPTFPGSGEKRQRRRPRHLPPALKGLMGEANLRYARGDREMAIKMCMEVIRQVPTAPDPFQMLAMLYEEIGSPEKSLQFALIAAHLDPMDAEQWIRLAAMSEDQGKRKQAVTCYSKAIRADPKNIDFHMKRAQLLEELGDKRQANRSYMRLLGVLSPDQGPMILHMAKVVAMKFHESNDLGRAQEAMEVAFHKCPNYITSEEVNMMLELLLSLRKYGRCLEILAAHCCITCETEPASTPLQSEQENLKIVSCYIPETIAIEIRAKLTVIMVHMKMFHLIDALMDMLMNAANPEEDGDLYLDVAEALISEGKHKEALRLTTPLVEGSKYSLPAVWLRHAECLKACDRLEEAASAYEVLVQQAPQHLEARVTLAGLLTQLGCGNEALVVLTQDPEKEVLDPGLLYERCMLLRDTDRSAEFLAVGQLLLSRHCVCIRNREELSILSRLRRVGKKNSALREVRKARGEPQTDPDAPFFEDGKNAPSAEEEWLLLLDLCNVCLQVGRYDLMQRFAFSALGSKRFLADASMAKEIEFLCLRSCLHNGDTFTGYNMVRDLVLRGTVNRRTWNVFNQVIQRADHVRQNRFFIRLMMRFLDHEGLLTLHANSCLVAGTYKYALIDYVSAFRVHPNPLVALLIGITLFQIACQKFTARKNSLVVQGLAFFGRYRQLRGPDGQQEVYYNLGRAFHQLGLLPAAVDRYEKVLEFKSEMNAKCGKLLDLKREAAFNLHLIYMKSDARDIANMYLHKYIVM